MSRKKSIVYFATEEIEKGHTCPYCGSNVFEVLDAEARWDWAEMSDFAFGKAFGILQCSKCGMMSILIYHISGDEVYLKNKQERDEYLFYHPEVVDLSWDKDDPIGFRTFLTLQGRYPCHLQFSRATPHQIRQDLNESCNCLAVGANRAAVIMCRRIIEHLAAALGEPLSKKNQLNSALNRLKKRTDIDQELVDRFFEVKSWGDLAAHVDIDADRIDTTEAKKIVDFVHNLVLAVYPLEDTYDPDKTLSELKQLRSQRKTGN